MQARDPESKLREGSVIDRRFKYSEQGQNVGPDDHCTVIASATAPTPRWPSCVKSSGCATLRICEVWRSR